MINVKVEQRNGKTYVFCTACNTILVTNDPSYFLGRINKNELHALGGCSHFEVIEVHKDEKSLMHVPQYEKNAVFKNEGKRYITFIVPRQS